MDIFSILFVIASVVFSVTSSVIAAKKARRAKKKAEAEADARKGFEIVVDGEIRALPIIYGRAKVGGVRTFHKVINRYENYISNADKVFEPGHLTVGTRSDKPVYLIFDQVLSKREITTFYDFIIDDNFSYDSPEIHDSFKIEAYSGITPTACNFMSATCPERSTAKFTGASHITVGARLNRDDPQFNGVPDVVMFVEGCRVRPIVGGVLQEPVYSNNPALVLLDYLTMEKGIPIESIDLTSFEAAAAVCDKIVSDVPRPVSGSIWQPKDGIREIRERDIPLYEANLMLDTSKPYRENIQEILETMGDAILVWSQGSYKLLLQYPGVDNAGIIVSDIITEDRIVLGEDISIKWPTADERLNNVLVRFNNEAIDFEEDTVSWPYKTDSDIYVGTGGKSFKASIGFGSNENGTFFGDYGINTGASTLDISWSFIAKTTGTYTLKMLASLYGTISINGVSLTLPEYQWFEEQFAHSGDGGDYYNNVLVTVDAPIITTVDLQENVEYTITATAGIDLPDNSIWGVTIANIAGALIGPNNIVAWSTRSIAYDGYELVQRDSTVYKAMLKEDNNVALEADISFNGITDYYHALAKAEEEVRMSRSAFTIKFTYHFEDKYPEPGDIVEMSAKDIGLGQEGPVYIRILNIEVVSDRAVTVEGVRFDWTQLAWNVNDNEYPRPFTAFSSIIPAPAYLSYVPGVSSVINAPGYLTWTEVYDSRVVEYVLYMQIEGEEIWQTLGSSSNERYDLPNLVENVVMFGVRSRTITGSLSTMTTTAVVSLERPIPPAPVFISAEVGGEYSNTVKITWEVPELRLDGTAYNDHLFTSLYVAASDDFDESKKVADVYDYNFHEYAPSISGMRYYWLQNVTELGVKSPVTAFTHSMLDDWAADGKLTGEEKRAFFYYWSERLVEYLSMMTQSDIYEGTELSSLEIAFVAWGTYLNNEMGDSPIVAWIPPPSYDVSEEALPLLLRPSQMGKTSNVDRVEFNNYAQSYFEALLLSQELLDLAVETRIYLTNTVTNIAQADADNALNYLEDWASDGIFSVDEKTTFLSGWKDRIIEYSNYKALADTQEIATSGLTSAINAWGTYLNGGVGWDVTSNTTPSWLTSATSQAINKVDFVNFAEVYFSALTAIKINTADGIGGSIDFALKDAANANATLEEWAADSWFTVDEKRRMQDGWYQRSAEYLEVRARAAILELDNSAEYGMLYTRFKEWGTYLNNSINWEPSVKLPSYPPSNENLPLWIQDEQITTSTSLDDRSEFINKGVYYFDALIELKTLIDGQVDDNIVEAGIASQAILKSIVFKRSVSQPEKPGDAEGSYDSPTPTGWSDGIPPQTSPATPLWASTRIFTSSGEPPHQASWTTTEKIGDVSSSVRHVFSVNGTYSTVASGDNYWHVMPAVNDVYMATQTSDNGGASWTEPVTGKVKIKGEQGIAGNAITGVTNQYSISNSSSSPGTWYSAVQTPTKLKPYLWNRETVTFTTGSTTTDPRVIGMYTEDGAVGKGISSIKEYYAVSNSTNAPTTGWVSPPTAIPTTSTTSKYLWNYEVITYTDTTTSSTTKRIIGTHGDTGPASNGISGVVNYYKLSSSGTSAPSTSNLTDWGTGVLTPTTSLPFLWAFEYVTYTISSTPYKSTPQVIAKYVTDGAPGRGILSIKEKYGVSSNASTQPTVWVDKPPVMNSTTSKYLWNYEIITYKDPTSTENTTKRIISVYGDTGDDGAGIEFIFCRVANSTPPETPTSVGGSWTADQQGVSEAFPYEYMSKRTKDTGSSTWSSYTSPKLWATYSAPTISITGVDNYYKILAEPNPANVTTAMVGTSKIVPTPTALLPYLYNYEKITYTSGDPTVTPPSIIGTYSADGRGISSIVEQYAINNSTTAPLDGAFTDDLQYTNQDNRYLWNREKITYTDSATPVYSSKRIISIHGQDGKDGPGVEFVFKQSITNGVAAITYPVGGTSTDTYKATAGYVPDGWSDDPQGVSAINRYEFAAKRTKVDGDWQPFSTPILWSTFAESGENSVVAILTNEVHTFSAAVDGTVTDYNDSGTLIYMYDGTTAMDYVSGTFSTSGNTSTNTSTTTLANGKWRIVSFVKSNISPATPTDGGAYANVTSNILMSADTASVTYNLAGTTFAGKPATATKVMTFSKSKAGIDGGNASRVQVIASSYTFTFKDNVLDPSDQGNITITPVVYGDIGIFVWSNDGELSAFTSGYLSTVSAKTLTVADFGSKKHLTISLTGYPADGSSAVRDEITIIRLDQSTASAGADKSSEVFGIDKLAWRSEVGDGQITSISPGKISTGSLSTGVVYSGKILLNSTDSPASAFTFNSVVWGVLESHFAFKSAIAPVGLVVQSTKSGDGSAIFGHCTSTSQTGAAVCGSNDSTGGTAYGGYFRTTKGIGVFGDTGTSGGYGFYTNDKIYAYGSVLPFTGTHIAYSQNTQLLPGQLVYSIDAWCVGINQTLVHTDIVTKEKDARVFGVVSGISNDILSILSQNKFIAERLENNNGEWTFKLEYQPYIDILINGGYLEVHVNAVGEGGITVCNENGDVINGDYLCSANLAGYAKKQDDDLLHNYTVAKALEDVIWANETETIKTIACTYHCG